MAEKILVASGKGGVGKTSVTVGLCKALHKCGKKVLVIDCDMLRSVDLLTGVTEKLLYDWGDVVLGRCEPYQAVYASADVDVMTCPFSYEGIDGGKMKNLVALFDEQYDYIFLDAPAGIGKGFELALSGADRALVVSTADLVCVRSACRAADVIFASGMSDVRLIINRVMKKDIKKGRLLNVDSVIDSTQVQLIGVIPEDKAIRLGSMGKNIYRTGQDSYIPFTNIAARVRGEYIDLAL